MATATVKLLTCLQIVALQVAAIRVDVETNRPIRYQSHRSHPYTPTAAPPSAADSNKGYSHTFVASPGMRKYRYGITHDPDGREFNINYNPLDTEVNVDNYLSEPQGYLSPLISPSASPAHGQYRDYSRGYDHIQLNVKVPSPHQMEKSSREIQSVHSAYSKMPVQPTKASLILKSPRPMAFEDFDLGLMGYGDFMDSYDDGGLSSQPKSPTYNPLRPIVHSVPGVLTHSTPRPLTHSTPRPLSHGARRPISYNPPRPLSLSTPRPLGYSTSGPIRYNTASPFSHTPRPILYSTPRPIVYTTPRPTPISYQPPVKFPQRVIKFPNSIDQNEIAPVPKFRAPKLQYGFKPVYGPPVLDKKPMFGPNMDEGHLESLGDKAFSKVFMSHTHDKEIPVLYSHTDHVTGPGAYRGNSPTRERGLAKTLLVPVILIPGSDRIPASGHAYDDYSLDNHEHH